MSGLNFGAVDVILVDPDIGARESLKMILRNQGFRNIRIGESTADICRYLEHSAPDLLITGADLSDGSVGPTIRALRHHEIGVNPFFPVIATIANSSAEQVRNIVDSGADDLLIKPLSTTALLSRINTLVNERKPFVVTFDYIGPDRQKSANRVNTVPLLDVPNTLGAKAKGEPVENVQNFIRQMISEINEQKLDRHIHQFHWLAKALTCEFAKQGASATFGDHLDRLAYVAQDAARRVEGTAHRHIADLCRSMIDLNARIHQNCKGPNPSKSVPRDLAVVAHMATAIQVGFTTGSEAAARQISEEIAL